MKQQKEHQKQKAEILGKRQNEEVENQPLEKRQKMKEEEKEGVRSIMNGLMTK